MTLEQTMQDALTTMRAQQNRITELEQQLESQRESHIRFIERLQSQINKLQEQVFDLLDPLERTKCAFNQPNDTK